MKRVCTGQRLTDRAASALLAELGEHGMMDAMQGLGFRLKPVRAPKGLTNGNLVLRYAWEKRDGNVRTVIRGTVILEAPGAV